MKVVLLTCIKFRYFCLHLKGNATQSGQQVTRCFNGDIEKIVMPINIQRLKEMLETSNYNKEETAYLVKGFTDGFDICYRGPTDRQDRSANSPFRIGKKFELWEKLMREVKLGRYAGPFEQIPFKEYMQSPIRLVLKAGNKT